MAESNQDQTKILSNNLFPVVGIGASAGGLEAFKKLVKAIPEDSGMAYILVQHVPSDHKGGLPEILQRETRVPVSEITDNVKVEPDHVYVIPANKMLVATDGILQLSPGHSKDQKNMPIDIFFTSLAEVHQSHSIGIVLSGNGADGTLGLKNIKDYGGITFAEDPGSAAYDSMPQNAIKAGVVDFILSPENMPGKLLKFLLEKQRTQMILDQTLLIAIVNASNDGIISQTLDGTITSWNLSAEKIFGYSAAEAIGSSISMIIPPDHLIEESQFLKSIKKGESIKHFETIRLKKDGTSVDVSLTISPLKDNDGKVIGAVTIVYDITERKKAEQQLADSEKFNKGVLASLSSHIAVIDKSGTIIIVNKAWDDFAKENGVTSLERASIGSNYFDVCKKAIETGDIIAEQALAGIQSVFKKRKKTFELEYPCHAPGQKHWFILHVMKFGSDDSKVVISHLEITARKLAEEKTINSSRLYAFISQINQTIVHAKDEATFFDAACRVAVEVGKFPMAWIGIADKATKKISLKASSGISESDINLLTDYSYDKGGPIEKTLNGLDFFVVNDIRNEPGIRLQQYALDRGIQSGISLAVKRSGKSIGCFTVYSTEIDFFDAEEIALLTQATGDISFALDVFEKEKLKQEAEMALRDSESNLRAIFENTSDGFILADSKGIIKSFNSKSRESVWLNSAQEINVGDSIFDFITESRKAIYRESISKVLAGEVLHYDYSYTWKDGETKWFYFTVNPVYNIGKIDSISITSSDITERKIAGDLLNSTSMELNKTLTDLNKLLDSSIDVICTVNVMGEFVSVNAASQKVWGYTPEELIGTKFMNLVFDEDVDITAKAAEKIVNNIQVPVFENRYLHKSGKVVLILWSVNWDEKLQLMFCIAKDVTEKKELEKAIKNERDQFLDIFLKAPLAFGTLKGADHVFEIVNPLFLKLIGKKSVIGRTVAEALSELIEQGFLNILDTVYASGKSYTGTEVLVKLDKEGSGELTDTYLNFVYQAYKNNEGNIEGIFFFINDITEQILSRKEIEKSEKFFKGVIENSNDMIVVMDATGKTIYVSPAVSKVFGYTIQECLEINMADVVHPDDALILQEFVGKIMMHPGVPMVSPLIRNRKKDGSYIWIEGTLTNFLATEGINAIVSNFRDVTESKKVNEKDRFKARLLSTIGQAAVATDLNGIINYWNRAAEDIYGWTKEEALGKNVIDLTPSEATAEQGIQIMEKLKSGQTWSGEFKVRKKDGTNFPAHVTDSPIYDENNIFSGIIGISSDITEKKKLEELLDKTNKLAAIGSWEIDVIKGTVFWSDITKQIREADPDFIPDLTSGMQFFKEGSHRNTISKRVMDYIDNGIPWDDELQILTQKGNLKWIRTIGEGEFINGKCIRIYGSFQDIDARKKAEIQVLKAYEEKNIILESIGDGFFAVDTNWVVTYWNNQAEKLLHRSAVEMIGKNLLEVYSHNIDSLFYVNFKKAIEENCVQHFESYSEKLETWYELSAYPSVSGLSVYFKDITQRKLSEQQIKADKNLLRTLIDNLPDTIFYKDRSAKKLISNKFDYYSILGAETEQEVLGKTDLEISSLANALVTYAQDMEILNTGKPLINFEEYFTTADNKPLWLLTSKLPLRNEDNEIIGLLGIGRDITQRKIAEEKLLELNAALEKNIKQLVISNAELEQFAYVASHDLQEPLRMITNFLTLLEKKYRGIIDDKGQQYIDFAVDGGIRMRQIILDLLEFSRVGRTEDKIENVDLNEVVNDILSLQAQQIQDLHAAVKVEKLPRLSTYKAPMRQIFQNLINNGLKYHRDRVAPEISISVINAGKFWQFAISDNGIGIGHAYLDKIFIIFQR
ncbi:MAG: PAS domain S-box protein, partial [Ginsengibacter sp.]